MKKLLASIILTSLPLEALSSSSETEESKFLKNLTRNLSEINYIGGNSPFSGSQSAFNIDISNESGKASIKLGAPLYKRTTNNNLEQLLSGNIELGIPVNKDDNSFKVDSFDSVRNATSISIGLDLSFAKPIIDENTSDELKNKACLKYEIKPRNCNAKEIKSRSKKEFSKLSVLIKSKICEEEGIDLATCTADTYSDKVSENLRKISRTPKEYSGWIIPLRYELGKKSYEFLDENSFEKQKNNEEPYKVSLGLGRLKGDLFMGVSLEKSKGFKSQDELLLCEPSEIPNFDKCTNQIVGEPSVKSRNNIIADIKWKLRKYNLGASFKVTHDLKNDETAFELPLYMLSSTDLKANIGLKFNWNTETEDLAASLFYAKPLELKFD